MAFSTFLANSLLNHTYVNTAFSAPTTWWASLHFDDTGDDGTNEEWLDAYRVRIDGMDVSTVGSTTNTLGLFWDNLPLVMPTIPSTITHVAVWDLHYGGNCFGTSELTTPRIVYPGDSMTIDPGELTVSVI